MNGTALARRLRLAGFAILVAGLIAAGVAYLRAPADPYGGAVGYEIAADGNVYPVMPGDSKSGQLQMERAGTLGQLAVALAGWFHGRKLAYALAFFSFGGWAVFFVLARLQARLAALEDDAPPAEKDP